jgi:hypothetical protein
LFPVTFVAFHIQLVGVFVDASVNWTVKGAVPLVVSAVNPATGTGSETLMNVTCVETFEPPEFAAFNEIE